MSDQVGNQNVGFLTTWLSHVVLSVLDTHPLLASFQLMLLEHIVMCRLIMGNKTTAITEVSAIDLQINIISPRRTSCFILLKTDEAPLNDIHAILSLQNNELVQSVSSVNPDQTTTVGAV